MHKFKTIFDIDTNKIQCYIISKVGKMENKEFLNEIKNKIVDKTEKEMNSNERVIKLKKAIVENNISFFEVGTVREFQNIYNVTDSNGKDMEVRFYNDELYKKALNLVNSYKDIMNTLTLQKEKLQKGFHLFKNKRLAKIDLQINSTKSQYEKYKTIFEKEENYKKHWFENGHYVDINENLTDELSKLKKEFTMHNICDFYKKDSQIASHNFNKFDNFDLIDRDTIKYINEFQHAINANNNQNIEKTNKKEKEMTFEK